ncbi:MAG: hypothetical protein HYY84_20125 [Deltaproteobacteria bacterium]|nr:hypothetical protein [Deltaproteobacteria bacterium]
MPRQSSSADPNLDVPPSNLAAFRQLYVIEVTLRELIIERLSALEPDWLKQRIPGDEMAGKIKDAREKERKTRWTRCIPHHPVYYLDFPDLATLIERKDNWKQAFKDLFLREGLFVSGLRQIEPIRNKVAHNRKLSEGDVTLVAATLDHLTEILGRETVRRLASKCTMAADLPTKLSALRDEARMAHDHVSAVQPLPRLEVWSKVSPEWWFDGDYLSADLTDIRAFFALLREYEALPRHRGAGHALEKWVTQKKFPAVFDRCDKALKSLLAREGANE